MAENDDLSLDASDLSDIFGVDEPEVKAEEDLGKSIEDLFLSDDSDDSGDDDLTLAIEARLAGLEEEADEAAKEADEASRRAEEALAAALAAEEAAKKVLADLESGTASAAPQVEPEPEAPSKREGMSEEEWKASPEYADFKKQVIARHLKRKAEEQAGAKAAGDEQAKKEAEAEARERAQKAEEESKKAEEEKKNRTTKALDAYKKAKQDAAAKKAADGVKVDEKKKEQNFKDRLADLKAKVKSGTLAPKPAAVSAPAAGGLQLDIAKCQALGKMYEATRVVLMKLAADKIGKKPSKALMKNTAMKASKPFNKVFGRADVDRKGNFRSDGALDLERFSRNMYALPPEKRSATVRKALYALLDVRFIGLDAGLGTRDQSIVVSKMLTILENSFKKEGYPADLVSWYFKGVVPDTVLPDSDDGF